MIVIKNVSQQAVAVDRNPQKSPKFECAASYNKLCLDEAEARH